MFKADKCSEGHFCGEKTTTNIMYSNKCPTGYYSDTRASGLEDYFLCEPGYYCPTGSSKSKYKQNQCLVGYYCPRGTAGDLTINATFEDGVH